MNINIFFLHNLPQKGHQAPCDSREKCDRAPIAIFEQNKQNSIGFPHTLPLLYLTTA